MNALLTLGGFIALLGLFIVLAWHTHHGSWIQWGRDLPRANYGAGIALFLTGMGLLALFSSSVTVSVFFGGLILAASLLPQTILWERALPLLDIQPGRLAIGTILCLWLAGGVILAGWRGLERLAIVQGLAGFVIFAVGFIASLGYLSGIPGGYRWWGETAISPHEAIGFTTLGIALILFGFERERQLGKNKFPYLAVRVGFGVMLATVFAWNAFRLREIDKFELWLTSHTGEIRTELATRLDGYVKTMAHLTRKWDWEGIPRGAAWDRQLKVYQDTFHFEEIRHSNALLSSSSLFATARRERNPLVLRAPGSEESEYEIWIPLFEKTKSQGFLVARFALGEIMNYLLQDGLGDNFEWTIWDGNSRVYLRKDNLQHPVSIARTLTVLMAKQSWHLTLRPTEEVQAAHRSFIPETVFGLGTLLALWLAVVIHLSQLAKSKALEAERMNGILRREISERERVQKELERASAAAMQAAQAKSDFLANMSHEIRTPLNAVIGMSDMLVETRLSREQKEAATIIQYSGKALLALINDILDFSKIEAGKIELESIPFDLADLLKGVQKMLAPEARSKRLHLSAQFTGKFSPALLGDANRIRQVLINLVNNAIKFTEKGRVTLTVKPEAARDGGHFFRFEVRDTGIGIPKDAQERLFSAFSQGDSSTTRKYGGTGLGLSICKRLVERMGGEIGFTSHHGKGSEFWFRLPLKAAGAMRVVESDRRALKASSLLLVEDNVINQKVMKRLLNTLGMKVTVAPGGKEALKLMRRQKFDLILMDCQMPGMDGFEVTRAWRAKEEKGHLPIVALTAHASTEDRQKCESAGMDDFLTKPVDRDRLTATLSRWLAPANGVVDKKAFAKLRELSDETEFLGEMVRLFREQGVKTLAQLRSAFHEKQAEAFWQSAHSLKSAAGNLGAIRVAVLCQEIEKLGKSGKLSEAKPYMDRLEVALREAGQSLEREAA